MLLALRACRALHHSVHLIHRPFDPSRLENGGWSGGSSGGHGDGNGGCGRDALHEAFLSKQD